MALTAFCCSRNGLRREDGTRDTGIAVRPVLGEMRCLLRVAAWYSYHCTHCCCCCCCDSSCVTQRRHPATSLFSCHRRHSSLSCSILAFLSLGPYERRIRWLFRPTCRDVLRETCHTSSRWTTALQLRVAPVAEALAAAGRKNVTRRRNSRWVRYFLRLTTIDQAISQSKSVCYASLNEA